MRETGGNIPKYLFTLISEFGTVICVNVPMEYESLSIDFNRDMDYGGVFVEFSSGTLTFTGSKEKRALRQLWDERGFNAVCRLRVSFLDMTDRVYKAFENDFELDFNKYSEVTLSKSNNGVRLEAKPVGILRKLKDRKGVEVDLNSKTSIEGFNISEPFNWGALRSKINIPEIIVYRKGWYSNIYPQSLTASIVIGQNIAVPMAVTKSGFNESIRQGVASNISLTTERAFFSDSEKERDLELMDGNIIVNFGANGTGNTGEITFYLARIDSDGSTLLETQNLGSLSYQSGATKSVPVFSKDMTLPVNHLLSGQSLILWGVVDVIQGDFTFNFGANSAYVQDKAVNVEATVCLGLPIYEALERSFQLILDTQYPIKSDFFGRLDVAKNAAGDLYTSENQLRFASILNGLALRSKGYGDLENSFSIKPETLFVGLNAVFNIGLGYETISGVDKLVIEERSYFFSDVDGLDLTGRINDIEIQFEALPDLAYAQIETGYESYEYEVINGLGEYNTKSKRTSVLAGKNMFNNVSEIRADVRGITLALERATPPGDGSQFETVDYQSDKHMFILKTQKNIDEWDLEMQENIQVLNDSSFFGLNSFNLLFTPTRNMLRHAYEIACGLALNTYIRFQTADKVNFLETTNGVDYVKENSDISVSDIEAAKWKGGQWIVELPFYEADIKELLLKKHQLITLTSSKKGWLLNAKYGIFKKKIELFILPKLT